MYQELEALGLEELKKRLLSPCPDGDEYAVCYYQEVAYMICKQEDAGIQFLRQQLSNPEENRVRAALFALGTAKARPDTVSLLVSYLADRRPMILAEAMDGLTHHGYREAIERIVPFILESSDPYVIGAALRYVSASDR